jgi:hypothetical protein
MTHICSQGEADKEMPMSWFNLTSEDPDALQSAQSSWKRRKKTKEEDEWRRRKRCRVYRLQCLSPVTMILLILHNEMLITSARSYLDRRALRSWSWNPLAARMHDSAVFCCVAQDMGRYSYTCQGAYLALWLETWADTPGKGPTLLLAIWADTPGNEPTVLCYSRHGPIHLAMNLPCCVAQYMGRSSWRGTYCVVLLETWADTPGNEPTVLCYSIHGPILLARNLPCCVARDMGRYTWQATYRSENLKTEEDSPAVTV